MSDDLGALLYELYRDTERLLDMLNRHAAAMHQPGPT
jgi:hypothetical protein